MTVAVIAVIMIAAVAAVLLWQQGEGEKDDLVTKPALDIVLELSEMPAGWAVETSPMGVDVMHDNHTDGALSGFKSTATGGYEAQLACAVFIYDSVWTADHAFDNFVANEVKSEQNLGPVHVGDQSLMIYHQGTTTNTKIVMFTHQNVLVFVLAEYDPNFQMTNSLMIELSKKVIENMA